MRVLMVIRKKIRLILFILLLLLAVYSSFLFLTIGQRGFDEGLFKLSQNFVTGHLTLPIINLPIRDIANYYNNYYLYFGPLASILLMPFALIFKITFPQVVIGVSSIIASFIAVYFIAKKFDFNSLDSLWLSLFFSCSTVLFSSGLINITAYQVEALGVPFILFAIVAYLYKKPPLLVGTFIGLAVMTRFTLMLSVFFFFIEFLYKRISVKHLFLLLVPVIISLLILGAYNQRRFHSVFETGYNYNNAINTGPISLNLKYKDISVMHIPANLYSFLIMAPEPLLEDKNGGMVLKFPYVKANPWGIAIWFTSPLFLFFLTNFKIGKYTLSSAATALTLSIPVFLWYSIGYAQVGYRYALDFLPFLFLLLIPSLQPKLSKSALFLITIGVIFNCIIVDSIWEIYPLFNIYPK